jgi:dienelactone hydrolase
MKSLFLLISLFLAFSQAITNPPPPFRELSKLYDYSRKAPLGLKEQGIENRDEVTIIRLSYVSPKGGTVPGLLLVPAGKGRFAGLLFMHPAGSEAAHSYFLEEALEFSRQGAVSLLVDAPFARPAPDQVPLFAYTEKDRDTIVQCVVDLRRGVDLLLSRSDIDSKQIGFVGSSYGATVGGILAGVEKRIKAFVLIGGAAKLTSLLYTLQESGADELRRRGRFMAYLQMMTAIDPDAYVQHAAPAALFFQSARLDQFIPREDASAFYQAASDPKELKWYDADHGFNDEARADRAAWLGKMLKMDQ